MKLAQPHSGLSNGQVPIVLGVIGHRNIDVRDKRLMNAVRGETILLRQRYRHSPFIILSALAEGADRLVAQVAMDELSARLIAVLPLPAEEFERDFASEKSKAEFRSFLKKALCVKTTFNGDAASLIPGSESRDHQYARAGAVIVDHVQILFALWDGFEARGVGGTADQVEWFRCGCSPKQYSLYKDASSPLDPLEPGRMIQIDPTSAGINIFQGPNFPEDDQKGGTSNIASILARINDYNADVLSKSDAPKTSAPLARIGNASRLGITNAAYQSADSLSVRCANTVRRTDRIIYLLALGAVLAFNFISARPWAPWLYLGITFGMLALAAHIWLGRKDDRALEYRSFAEAMRTLFFWRAVGVKRSVWLAFLSRQSGVVHWIRHAVRTIEFCQDCLLHQIGAVEAKGAGGGSIKEAWVDNQKAWFTQKELYHYDRSKFWNSITRWALVASFMTAILLAALTAFPLTGKRSFWAAWVQPQGLGDYWQAALGLLTASGIAARGYVLRSAHLELAKQYASQKLLFENASRWLTKISKHPEADWTVQDVLEKLGQEALQEQSDWLWLRHTRPFELPAN